MKLTFVEPRIELKPFIQSMWVCHSDSGLPSSDVSLAAPNGRPKLVVTCSNSLVATAQGRSRESPEGSISLVGIRDVPVVLSTAARKTCFIGIEFFPSGAFPLFGIPMVEMTNRLVAADELPGSMNRGFEEAVGNVEGVAGKVDLIQERLLAGLNRGVSRNPAVEYCVAHLGRTHGGLSVSELEVRTGYDRRTLEVLFKKHVGVSPKTLAGIFRFQRFYGTITRGHSYDDMEKEMHQFFYDQAHFSKDFKRKTGFAPRHFFQTVTNEFGRQLAAR